MSAQALPLATAACAESPGTLGTDTGANPPPRSVPTPTPTPGAPCHTS